MTTDTTLEVVPDNKASEIINEENRTRITDIVFVLQTLYADHLSSTSYPGTRDINTLIARIDADAGKDDEFPKGSTRAEIAKSFLREFGKIEALDGPAKVRSVIFHKFKIKLSEASLPTFSAYFDPQSFTNKQLIDAIDVIANSCGSVDQTTNTSSCTEFRKAFYTAMGQPELAPASPSLPPQSTSLFWRRVGGTAIVVSPITTGLIYDSQQNWAVCRDVCHAIASHPEISVPVGVVLLLVVAVGSYVTCTLNKERVPSNGVSNGN